MLQYFETLTDSQGNSLYGAIVTVYNYPALTLASIYSTNGTASPVASSAVSSDITGQVSFYVPDGAYQLTYAYKGTVYKTKSPVQMIDPMGLVIATDSGTANAYVVTGSQYPASLYKGLKLSFQAANSNIANPIANPNNTLNLNSTGAQAILLPGGNAPSPGMIAANGIYILEWDGSEWQLLNPTQTLITSFVVATESRTNTTVLANSSYLTGPVGPGTYEFVVTAVIATPASAGIQFEVAFSGTAPNSAFTLSGAYGANSNVGQVNSTLLPLNSPISVAAGSNTAPQIFLIVGSLQVTVAGTLAFAFAQQSAQPSATTLAVGSYAKLTPLA